MRSLVGLALLAATSLAAPGVEERQSAPTVKIQNGTVVGSSTGGVESFKGIPFAQPPIGNLRLRAPRPLAKSFGTFQATGMPASCPQQTIGAPDTSLLPAEATNLINQLLGTFEGSGASEDCLTINVQRPAGTTASSKLPVVFWIYGGGFEAGSTGTYDGSLFISRSVDLSKPVVYVAVNYRVSGFGFLAGKELQQEGNTNLGLRDQRLGMQWVQDNIAAFGGDPKKVTIWGESAGSISVFDHTIINGGNNLYKGSPLFRGAIMNSGSVVPALDVSSPTAQAVFDKVAAAGGCSRAANKLTCLRNLSYDKFKAATDSVPGIFSYRSVDLSYLPRPDPHDNFFARSPDVIKDSNAFAKVPIIIGDQQDEGTLFSLVQSNITTTAQLVTYLKSYFPLASRKIVQGLVDTYPDDPSYGSPFGTGPLYNIYPQYKRLAAILGDATFTLTRRAYLDFVAGQVPAWSYLNTYLHGVPVIGTTHGLDILSYYYDLPNPAVALSQQTHFIAFINNLDPNSITSTATPVAWPKWTASNKKLLQFAALGNSIIKDNFRNVNYQYLKANTQHLRV